MTQFLRTVLEAEDPLFSHAIQKLEAMTGRRSIDIAYTMDIKQRAQTAMRLFGLDPADTTPLELYHSLKARSHDAALFESTDDVAVLYDEALISFNECDVAASRHAPYDERETNAVREAIHKELVARYVAVIGNEAAVHDVLRYAGIGRQRNRKGKK